METAVFLLQAIFAVARILLALTAIFVVSFYIRRSKTIRDLKKFPGTHEAFPFIDFLETNKHVSRRVQETGLPYRVLYFEELLKFLADHMDDGVCVRYFGGEPEMFMFRADHAERLLTHQTNIAKGYPYEYMEPIMGKGLVLLTGTTWKSHRKMFTPAFHFQILDHFVLAMNAHSRIFVDRLLSKHNDEDVMRYISALTLDILCQTVMSTSAQCQTSAGGQTYLDSLHSLAMLFMTRMSNPLIWNDFVFNLSRHGRKQKELLDVIHSFTQWVLEDRIQELKDEALETHGKQSDGFVKSKKPFIDTLIHEHLKGNISFTEMRDEVNTFMFAGHDTTGSALGFATYLIGLHPEVQARLHEEVDTVIGRVEDDIRPDQLKEMHYLEMVLKECQRLYPPVPMLNRKLVEPMKIDGKVIPEGTQVTLGIIQLHRDPNVFPDPEKFDPERFAPENAQGRHPFAFLPFSAGPRNCIGSKFALLEEKMVMCWLLRRFEWTSPDPRETLITSPDLVLRPIDRVRIHFSVRQS